MNRITSLAAEAHDIASSSEWEYHEDWFKVYNKTLAELVIRECVDIAYNHNQPKMSGPGVEITANIYEHFGIWNDC